MTTKVALVTGGTRGIGRAFVTALKKDDYKVAVVAQSWDEPNCDLFIREDLSSLMDGVGYSAVEKTVQEFGRIDVLVNNAGVQSGDWDLSMRLMLTVPYKLSYEAAKHMTEGGHIVNILSTSAFQGARNITPYVVAKHGLLGLTRAMAVELAPKIHVNAIAPGLTNTDMTKDIGDARRKLLESITPAGRFGKPYEMAEALMYLVNSTYVYGQTITVDGGWMVKNG